MYLNKDVEITNEIDWEWMQKTFISQMKINERKSTKDMKNENKRKITKKKMGNKWKLLLEKMCLWGKRNYLRKIPNNSKTEYFSFVWQFFTEWDGK